MPLLKLSRKERRRFTVFLTSLLLAVFAWLFFSLSNRYPYTVNTKINYINPPFHKAYRPLQDDTVSLYIEGTGWQLLFSRLRISPPVVNVSLKALNYDNFITLSSQITDLNSQLQAREKILSVYPDTLFFDFSARVTKKVPVKLMHKLRFEPLYGISGPIKIIPDSVMVTGTAEDLKSISVWQTEFLALEDINSRILTKVNLAPHKNTIDVIPEQVKLDIPVDEFTEKVIDVPVKVFNHKGFDVTLLPEEVRVTVRLSVGNYPKIEKDSFLAKVDLNGWIKYRYNQLPVTFSKFPAYSKLVKVEPQVVDFIIKD